MSDHPFLFNFIIINFTLPSYLRTFCLHAISNKRCLIPVALFLIFNSCNEKSKSSLDNTQGFLMMSSAKTGIGFINQVEDQQDFNILNYRNFYNGGGVAIGDINNDQLPDIYFTANISSNHLYLNKGNWVFEDITELAGVAGNGFWSTGVTMADVNHDGWMDIYVCNSGDGEGKNRKNELFINQGNLTFLEKAEELGLADDGFSTHAAFFDYDLDGDLDCFVLNNSYTDPKRIQSNASGNRFNYGSPGGDRLYQNIHGHFEDRTKESGIFSGDIDFGLGISVGDVNQDHYPDLYVSNDFWERDYLYINQKDGTFRESLTERMAYVSANSMGSDIADINNDGFMDIFSTDMLPPSNRRLKAATKFEEYFLEGIKWRNSYFFQFIQNCLHVNQGDGTFIETAYFSGLSATDWSWGALIFDMDHDGLKDIFVSNGIYHDITDLDFIDFIGNEEEIRKVVEKTKRADFRDFVKLIPLNKQKNYAFLNRGGLLFDNQARALNLDQEGFSNGSAYGDLDNDGDYDLVVNNVNMEAYLFQNRIDRSANNQYLKIRLRGMDKNTYALGSEVTIYGNGRMQTAQVMTARGFQSSVDPDLIFGCKGWSKIDSLYVIWPDGKIQWIHPGPAFNQTLTLSHADASFPDSNPSHQSVMPGFAWLGPTLLNPPFVHHENSYNDFDHERLMPHMLSNEGPKILYGDVNGDHREDIILLDAMDSVPKLYLNTGKGWQNHPQPELEVTSAGSEAISGALFDEDQDGDLDLLLGCGGNEYQRGTASFSTRFYINDGKGNFQFELTKGPRVSGHVSCIRPHDFNKDGKTDLFIGCKSIPGAFGLTPRSYLLRNAGRHDWVDVTSEESGPLGMVSDACWVDINQDQMTDLILAGEWMPVTVLTNNNGTLTRQAPLPQSNGWWNVIHPADLDDDGDMDFVLGNWGTNMKFQASPEKPLKMFLNDFDGNGKTECILEWYAPEDERPFPFASKQDLTSQMPMLKKSSLKYTVYSTRQVRDLFSKDQWSNAEVKYTDNFNTSFLWNDSGQLRLQPMPPAAQLSPVFAVEVADIDRDGLQDIILGGNFYRLKPEVGRLDGNWGGYFRGRGNRQYDFIGPRESGLQIRGEVRDIWYHDRHLFYGRNGDSLVVVSGQ